MKFYRLDDSARADSYVIVSQTGRCFRLSQAAYTLLRARDAGLSHQQISGGMNEAARVPPEQLERLESFLRRILTEADAVRPQKPSLFAFATPILSSTIVVWIVSRLLWMFSKWMALIVPLGALGLLFFGNSPTQFSPSDAVYSYALFLLSLFFHEFGHASACLRFGVRPGEIGFGVIIVYPALYSDVSAAWILSRWRRAVVDVSGNYFQIVFGVVCLWGFIITSWPPFFGALLFIGAGVALSLNPVFRFDGYWVMSDLLGVPNLAAESRNALLRCITRRREPHVGMQEWSQRTRAALVVYGAVSGVVWMWFATLVWPALLWDRASNYPVIVSELVLPILNGRLPSLQILATGLLASAMLYASCVLLLRGLSLLRSTGRSLLAAIGRRETISKSTG